MKPYSAKEFPITPNYPDFGPVTPIPPEELPKPRLEPKVPEFLVPPKPKPPVTLPPSMSPANDPDDIPMGPPERPQTSPPDLSTPTVGYFDKNKI